MSASLFLSMLIRSGIFRLCNRIPFARRFIFQSYEEVSMSQVFETVTRYYLVFLDITLLAKRPRVAQLFKRVQCGQLLQQCNEIFTSPSSSCKIVEETWQL